MNAGAAQGHAAPAGGVYAMIDASIQLAPISRPAVHSRLLSLGCSKM